MRKMVQNDQCVQSVQRIKRFKRIFYCLLPPACYLLLSGCGLERRIFPKPSSLDMSVETERLSDVPTSVPASAPVAVGSLWPADDHVFFYADKKALRVGDILTVSVVETAQANSTADTSLTRESSINARLGTFLNARRFLGLSTLGQDLVDSTAKNAHTGSGTTSREGKLTASITAIVTHVLRNGNLVIKGSRSVTVNNEEQFITLTGIVRPQDIGRDNAVLSTQIADADITFGGLGVVGDKQRSGWGTWIFDWLWPF